MKLAAILTLITTMFLATAQAAERPNILWITAEDMSMNLGCYGDSYAITPEIDQLAKESVRYTHAFATAPVCSPSRSTLITGCYATSLGTQRLRSLFPIPDFIKGFPEYLREEGFFTSNNAKTDYNIADEPDFIEATWDRNGSNAHWRQRESGKPFFSVFNLMTTHQSRANVWPWEQFEKEVGSKLEPDERHDADEAPIWPFYPDTPTVRKTVARYYDCITVMDKQVGELLQQLEDDGLADNTIVFFYSDHGMGMPRGKRLLHDSGMQIPMLIRFPEKWKHLAPAADGATTDRMVSFVDFAPTVLSLLELPIPDYMQGTAFLGKAQGSPRQFVFGARDRVDEAFDLSRSARDNRYLLIRNYMPHLPWMQPERYSDNADMRRELKHLAEAGKLEGTAALYAQATRPVIEFYDTIRDPHQVKNLMDRDLTRIESEALAKLSIALDLWETRTKDLGFIPEPIMWDLIETTGSTPWEIYQTGDQEPFNAFRDINRVAHAGANAFVLRSEQSTPQRYWNAVNLNRLSNEDPKIVAELKKALNDNFALVRIECAAGLLSIGSKSDALDTTIKELSSPSVETRLHAIRALELAGGTTQPAEPDIRRVRDEAKARTDEHPCWMFIEFSADAILEKQAHRQSSSERSL